MNYDTVVKSDITINNRGKYYKLHKIMLISIQYFKHMFSNGFKENFEDVIETDFEEKYWSLLVDTIYKYEQLELYENFDEDFVEFLSFLGMNNIITRFHERLLIELKSGLPNHKLLDYCIKQGGLRCSLKTNFLKNMEISKMYKFLYTYSKIYFAGDLGMCDGIIFKECYDEYFRDEIIRMINNKDTDCKDDLYILVTNFGKCGILDKNIIEIMIGNYENVMMTKRKTVVVDYGKKLWSNIFETYPSLCNFDMLIKFQEVYRLTLLEFQKNYTLIKTKGNKQISEKNELWLNLKYKKLIM